MNLRNVVPLLRLFVALLSVLPVACSNPLDQEDSRAAVIGFEPSRIGLGVGREIQVLHPTSDHEATGRAQLLVVMRDADGHVLPFSPRTFSSSAPAIVDVDPDGVLHPKQPGTATISASDGNTRGELEVVVVPTYSLVHLGGSASGSVANAINDSGAAVGRVCQTCAPILWRDGQAVPLGSTGEPRAINNEDVIVGTGDVGIWQDGVSRAPGIPSSSGSYWSPNGINDNGDIVGEIQATGCSRCPPTGFLARGEEIVPLDFQARDINVSGTIVGSWYLNSATPYPVVYRDGIRSVLSESVGDALAVNDNGLVVGTSSSAGGAQAALWADGKENILGVLRGYPYRSDARAINEAGEIVGRSEFGAAFSSEQSFAGFLWRDGLLMNLNHLHDVADWEVVDARGINDAGQIVGTARHGGSGATSAIRLDP